LSPKNNSRNINKDIAIIPPIIKEEEHFFLFLDMCLLSINQVFRSINSKNKNMKKNVSSKKMQQKLRKILTGKNKPLVGNNRSFSNKSTKRKFQGNVQKFKIGNEIYKLRARNFRFLRSC